MRFGRGALEAALPVLGDGFVLLTTPRALRSAPQLGELAGAVHEVPPGTVDELASGLVGFVGAASRILALGGGRVIDTAKALAAARAPGRRPLVGAVPTTLSAAEMTSLHRRAAGADRTLPGARPALVVNDPALSASQPPPALAASAANALAHALEGPATVQASPLPALAGREAARLIAAAYEGAGGEPDRDALALGALLSGYAIDGAGYGLHHVLAQTLARTGAVGHGQANSVLLEHTLGALRRRGAAIDDAAVALAARLARLAGASSLRALGVDEHVLAACAEVAGGRAELDNTPPRAQRGEIEELYAAAL